MNLREKQILRTAMRVALAEFTGRVAASTVLRKCLRASSEWSRAGVIYGFHPMSSEPDWLGPAPIDDKQIVFPRTQGRRMSFLTGRKMVAGSLGMLEPEGGAAAPPPDLILVPGLAFTCDGHRLGRGGGFYDRWLATQAGIPTVGICFSCQLVDAIPVEPHDVRVDAVVTEEGWAGDL